MKLITKLSQYALLLVVICCAISKVAGQKNIPDDIAFGEATKGGLNGQVIRVTTLDASGPGSLHEAIILTLTKAVLKLQNLM